jgi:hypothetical protein
LRTLTQLSSLASRFPESVHAARRMTDPRLEKTSNPVGDAT